MLAWAAIGSGTFDLGQCPARAALDREGQKDHRGRSVALETLLMFLVLIGSFALVGLLVRFSEKILRPVGDIAAADHRDKVPRIAE